MGTVRTMRPVTGEDDGQTPSAASFQDVLAAQLADLGVRQHHGIDRDLWPRTGVGAACRGEAEESGSNGDTPAETPDCQKIEQPPQCLLPAAPFHWSTSVPIVIPVSVAVQAELRKPLRTMYAADAARRRAGRPPSMSVSRSAPAMLRRWRVPTVSTIVPLPAASRNVLLQKSSSPRHVSVGLLHVAGFRRTVTIVRWRRRPFSRRRGYPPQGANRVAQSPPPRAA